MGMSTGCSAVSDSCNLILSARRSNGKNILQHKDLGLERCHVFPGFGAIHAKHQSVEYPWCTLQGHLTNKERKGLRRADDAKMCMSL